VCVLALSVLAFCTEAARVPQDNFRDFFDGKWEVEIRPNSDPSSPGSVSNGVYVMKKMEGKLMGIYYENVTSTDAATGLPVHTIENQLRVRVEIDSPTQGVFRTALAQTDIFTEDESEEPSLKFKTLFEFDFQVHRNGIWVSTGDWHGKQKGSYQFMIMSSQAFLLTVTPNEGGAAQGQTISGYKDLKKSLWDSMGPATLCFIVLVGTKLLRNLGPAASRKKLQQRVTQAPSAAAGQGAGKKSQ